MFDILFRVEDGTFNSVPSTLFDGDAIRRKSENREKTQSSELRTVISPRCILADIGKLAFRRGSLSAKARASMPRSIAISPSYGPWSSPMIASFASRYISFSSDRIPPDARMLFAVAFEVPSDDTRLPETIQWTDEAPVSVPPLLLESRSSNIAE
ncbi:MAG: hypothetical protein FJ295_06005 [Planctomycetes bacterium]|nr:hypothetical protein [Planctomycetota bacterium]